MHSYMHHIGDYMRDTGHLTWQEHGIYRSLLDRYYLSERPISLDDKLVCRRLGAKSPEDIEAIKLILSDFFQETKDGWVHKRCSKVIEDYHLAAEKNRSNGKLGGRPAKPTDNPGVPFGFPNGTQTEPKQNPGVIFGFPNGTQTKPKRNPNKTQTEPKQNPDETQTEPKQKATINHKPETRNQKPTHTLLEPVAPINPEARVSVEQTVFVDKAIAAFSGSGNPNMANPAPIRSMLNRLYPNFKARHPSMADTVLLDCWVKACEQSAAKGAGSHKYYETVWAGVVQDYKAESAQPDAPFRRITGRPPGMTKLLELKTIVNRYEAWDVIQVCDIKLEADDPCRMTYEGRVLTWHDYKSIVEITE